MFIYFDYLLLNLMRLFILEVYVLIRVAFLTLLERKILSYVQNRKGPNKVGFIGLFQPFRDAIKLFNKELIVIYKSSYFIYYICPIILFLLMMMNWFLYDYITNLYFLNYSLLFLIVILTIIRYMFIFMGWFSNSLYSLLGAVRSISQTLSYEVSLVIIFIVLMILRERYSFVDFVKWQFYMWYVFIVVPVFLVFMIRVLAELNRSPIDFVEGESELVSGFNVEYFRGIFALIFIAEYGMILFFSYLVVVLFTGLLYSWCLGAYVNLVVYIIILMRGVLPRIRYDELIYLCWKVILPFILNYMIFVFIFKCIFMFLF